MRYEIKYVFPPAWLERVIKDILSSPYLFREIFWERQVNNIYMDTPSLQDYYEAVNGASNRSKTRIRWYGPLWQHTAAPVLEIKCKMGLSGKKTGFPLKPLIFDGDFRQRQFMDDLKQNPDIPADHLAPRTLTLINSYTRRYFITPDSLCRVTIDRSMRFYSLHQALMGADFCFHDNTVILEVKFEKEYLFEISNLFQSLGYRIGRNSKYVNGVKNIYFGSAVMEKE
jgi:hypothetical protein